ncbi:MAG TPA: dihydrolipoyllysine-residue acetyltransferase [Candidatus Thiothrix moscowensis]|uniref:dihydrolipoyllysine-residue acetyltransferase n=1 Tax=unclassified Thiothrix TaxID=2636184 RepID=UPI0025F6382A|nr:MULTISPECIES: dihydrolipoyllysine-residue acetyltransferase [unclassified Thiothrix]HRJ52576.1 dihydrolipoyllysine-residue acetyltransferase [Candidatus Thiothrix moscowensis]HRJ94280.1 dihydrolipoyllysine-residue acetyltransferase [Candidatus Thiothrix moscowensis]
MAIQEIFVPDIGSFKDVEVIEVLVSVGDTIAVEDSLMTIESDKASMEIPSSAAGVVKELKVKVGDRVSEGSLMLVLDVTDTSTTLSDRSAVPPSNPAPARSLSEAEGNTQPAPKPESRPQPAQSPTAAVQADLKNVDFSKAYATPSVRKFARELGVDLNKVTGSGRKKRITQEDVKGYVKDVMSLGGVPGKAASGGNTLGVAPMPDIDFSQWGEIETVVLSRINKLTGEFLHRNWVHIPHVTQFDQADITDLEAFRKQLNEENAKSGMKITPLVFIMKAVVAGLKAYPRFNASLDAKGENLIRKHYYHIGVAVDTPDGLVVPVIRDVDKKSIMQLSEELKEVSAKARDKKLKPADMQGGCFSISSLGGIGGTKFTPIVNAPEVAILGVSKSEMQPVWNGKEFAPRLMLPLSLSYDHRVIDGADGARFTTYLAKMLGDIRRLLV